jgi:cytochrome c oxidase subunit II
MGKGIAVFIIVLVLLVIGFYMFDGDKSESGLSDSEGEGLDQGIEESKIPAQEKEEMIVEEEFEEESEEEEAMEESEEEENMEETMSVQEFVISAERWEFTPSVITVSEGDTVKLTIDNTDTMHGISVPDFGAIGNEEVEFVADKKGTFTFYCNTYCGSGHSGMTGQIIVE